MAGRIAITATGNSIVSEVDERFGRAPFFMINDLDSGEWVAVDNSEDVAAGHGAGVQAAQLLVEKQVSAIVTGQCGPKATRVLQAAGIEIHTGFGGTVEEALKSYREQR